MVASLEAYVSMLERREIVDAVYTAAATILLYDLVLTLHLEIPLVWFSKWNYTKVLYLLTRYIPFAANIVILCNHLPGASGAACADTFKAAGWLYFVGLHLAEVILVIRTWACWGRNKWVGIGLAVWTLSCQIPSVVLIHKFLSSIRFGSPFADPVSNSCTVVYSDRFLWVVWFIFLLGEGAALILMVIFAYRTSRDGTNTPLVKIICRDGLTYYIYLFCVSSINIALTLALDDGFVAMVSPVQSAIHSALTTRIILNIRQAASQRLDDFSCDLHMSDTEPRAHRSQLRFVENPAGLHSDDDHRNDIFRRRNRFDSVMSATQIGVVTFSTSATISHVTLPMTRDAKGKRVAGRPELDEDDEDDDQDSICISPEDCV